MFFILVIVMLALPALAITPLAVAQEGSKPEAVGLRPDAPPYAVHGPYWVGTREFVIEPESDRPLPLTVWYPALNPEGKPEEISYVYENFITIKGFTEQGHAILDAAPDTAAAPYPLVIISHGHVWYRYAFAYLAEHLASYGFVVVAADHTGNTLAYGSDPKLMGSNMEGWAESLVTAAVYRPADIQREIDYATNPTGDGHDLAGMIDLKQIAVVGQSYGGYTALVSAGAQVNLSLKREWCNANIGNQAVSANLGYTMLCQIIIPSEAQMLALRGLTLKPGELWPPFDVTGVDAIVPIAPPWFFAPDSFEQVTVPALVIVGTKDYFALVYEDAVMTYENLPSDHKGLVVLENASHFFALSECNDWFLSQGSYQWCSEPVWDMDRAHDLTNHFTTAFLLAVLKRDTDAAAALAPDAVSFPGITYETTGF
jgi:predicted dienelactone hydrolase